MEAVSPATDFSFDWGGTSYQEKRSAGTAGLALGLAVVMVFFILAAQYEKWSLPLSVLLALPFGTFGALAAIWVNNLLIPVVGARPLTNDVYFQIGLVTLVGLITKHGILIVEFANQLQEAGKSKIEAVQEAAVLRLRPILMTTGAMVLGAIPLAIATGAGGESRQAIGWVIVGGMTLGTVLTLFVVPTAYSYLARDHRRGVLDADEPKGSAPPASAHPAE